MLLSTVLPLLLDLTIMDIDVHYFTVSAIKPFYFEPLHRRNNYKNIN